MSNITQFPGSAPDVLDDVDDEGAFSLDQIETLAHALAGLKHELSDAVGERIAASASIAKVELEARLAGAEDTAKTELHTALEQKFASLKDAIDHELGPTLAGLKDELRDAFDERLKAAASIAKVELEERLHGASDTVRTELADVFTERFTKLKSALQDEIRTTFEQRIAAVVRTFREENETSLGAVRSELLARIDEKNFGLMLSDVDPRMLARSLVELKDQSEERHRALGTKVVEAAKLQAATTAKEIGDLRQLVSALQSRLNSGETLAMRRAEGVHVKRWNVDANSFTATPVLADSSTGAALDLTPLFQRFFDDNIA